MNARAWRLREARHDDVDGLRRLFEACVGYPRDRAHLEWKFFANPFGRPLMVVAESDEELVGLYALWPLDLRIGGEVVPGAQSLDTMTHPAYRGQGMFPKLATVCMDLAASRGVRVLYGFPNANSYGGFVRKLNWDHTGDVSYFLRPLRPSRHPRVPASLGWAADAVAALFPRASRAHVTLDEAEPSIEERVALWNGGWLPSAQSCSVERSPEWERWRFLPAAGMNYRWVSARRAGALVGYAVWATDPRTRTALLSEVCAPEAAVLNAVVAEVGVRARRSDHPFLATVTSIPAVEAALRANGFLRRTGIPLIVRTLAPTLLKANVHDHASWRVLGADLDTY